MREHSGNIRGKEKQLNMSKWHEVLLYQGMEYSTGHHLKDFLEYRFKAPPQSPDSNIPVLEHRYEFL